MLRFALLCCVLTLSSCQPTSNSPDSKDARPNFLIIFTDDMGFTDLGAFGGGDIATPNLDRLARDGIRLTNFHGSVSCAPSRAMLMSGTGNHEAGLGTQIDIETFRGQVGYERRLTDRVRILPEVLQAGGYRTYAAGKWHLGGDEGIDPIERGFDKAFVILKGGDGHYDSKMGIEGYSLNGERLRNKDDSVFSTTMYVDHLLNFFKQDQDSEQPFFAWFTPTAPHWPMHFPPGMTSTYTGRYDEGYDVLREQRIQGAQNAGVLPPNITTDGFVGKAPAWDSLSADEQAVQARIMEIYAAMTDHLDQEIGQLLAYLKNSDQLDNTVILFINDNGAQGGTNFGAPSTFPPMDKYDNTLANLGAANSFANMGQGWAEAVLAPFRGSKATPYEGGVRVAAFASGPLVNSPGSLSFEYLNNMDVMPTLLELAELEHPGSASNGQSYLPLRGRSFAGLLRGSNEPVHAANEAIALSSAGTHFMARGDWKLLKTVDGEWELYNLSTDPYERDDRAGHEPKIFQSMLSDFEKQAELSNILDR